MPGEICTMPHCWHEQSYPGLGVCRLCYNRIYWTSRSYNKTLEEAMAALADMDNVAIKHGLFNSHEGIYSRRKNIIS